MAHLITARGELPEGLIGLDPVGTSPRKLPGSIPGGLVKQPTEPVAFGPQLPLIGDWTREHYAFAGYVTGFDPADFADRQALRQELSYRDDEQVCIVTVGGSGVGGALLRKVTAAYPLAKRAVPELRMIVVAGPRIDPASLPTHDGLEVRAFVPQLYRHLAACDLAVVQGGLTTCMELAANRRPFLYFPLRHHFEQNFHVRHRLARYGAGRSMDFELASPDAIADAVADELAREADYRPVETNGAARAAALIAAFLVGAGFLLATGHDPLRAYREMFIGAFGTAYGIEQTMIRGLTAASVG